VKGTQSKTKENLSPSKNQVRLEKPVNKQKKKIQNTKKRKKHLEKHRSVERTTPPQIKPFAKPRKNTLSTEHKNTRGKITTKTQ
jgi:hypothetical protein